MYPPLGLLSIATVLKVNLGNSVDIEICDEDVEDIDFESFRNFDIIGFYSTTFNYYNCVKYAVEAKNCGALTILGGPHPTILYENIMRNQECFDFTIKFEGEIPCLKLVRAILDKKGFTDIPNLVFKDNGKVVSNHHSHENNLEELPIPQRNIIQFERYIENFKSMYPERMHIRPGSIYSSKGCFWRDKTGGCVFCARLETGVRFRSIDQIWKEAQLLKDNYGVNSIWDISDDNLNNREWFKSFVERRPSSCSNLSFFLYSRISFIKPDIIDYFKELNVEEVFLGVESGDDKLLKDASKGQTSESTIRAVKLLRDNNIKYFPSFVLGLPGESEASIENTFNLCKKMSGIGGLDRVGCTILQPIPGSKAFDILLDDDVIGNDLKEKDIIDLFSLEEYWIEKFTNVDYEIVVNKRSEFNKLFKDYIVFGSPENEKRKAGTC
jgi:anaerobic magnesium-protoporphyrin IX monomethyl ester cyclase